MSASRKGYYDVVDLLLSFKADPNMQDYVSINKGFHCLSTLGLHGIGMGSKFKMVVSM